MSIVFGTDGVRAPFSSDLNAGPGFMTVETSFRIGVAAVDTLGLKKWVIVEDTRPFNPELMEAFKEGIASRGAVAADLGILPTPAGALVASWLGANSDEPLGTASFTASHNKLPYAGIKISGAHGMKLNDRDTKVLQAYANNLVLSSQSVKYNSQNPGEFNTEDLRELYINILMQTVDHELGFRFLEDRSIVLDAANGAAYWSAAEILGRFGAKVIPIHSDPNGEINKDCGATQPDSMAEAVRSNGASYGLALDGDADRLIAHTRNGNKERVLDGDDAIAIALSGLAAQRRIKVPVAVTTDYSTVGFKREMDRRGIQVKFVANGDRYVLEGLKATKAHIGAEKSGHILYPEVARKIGLVLSGDGTLAALQQLQVEAQLGRSLADISDWPLLGYSRKDLPLEPGINANKLVAQADVAKTIEANSQRVSDDGLILVRGSNTEPVVRLLVKTESQQLADEITAELETVLTGAVS